MSNFIQKRLDLLVEMAEHGINNGMSDIPIVMSLQEIGNDAPSAMYINKDTKEYYYLATNQYTILPCNDNNNDITTILTDKGKELYSQSQQRYEKGEVKDTLTIYNINQENSGSWYSDTTSPFYNKEECRGCFNTWNNRTINGKSLAMNEWITTSVVIFITPEWCLTKSGNLYKLGTYVDTATIVAMMEEDRK